MNIYMYTLNFRDFSNLNSVNNSSSTVVYNPTPNMVCSYCDSSEHTLKTCSIDNDLIKIMSCNEEPDFKLLSGKVLKKIAYLSGLKTTQPKIQILLQLKRIWMKKNKERNEKIEKLEKELNALKIQENIEECPICIDSLCKTNICVTKCGHKYCSTCFVRCVMKKNSCPMCREKIVEEEHYVKDIMLFQSDYIPFDEELIRDDFNLNLFVEINE